MRKPSGHGLLIYKSTVVRKIDGEAKYLMDDLIMFLLHFFLLGLQLDEALVGGLEQEVGLHGAVLVLLHPQRRLPGEAELNTASSCTWFNQVCWTF